MNKQEAIDKLNKKYDDFLSSPQPDGPFLDGYISALVTAKDIINQIDELQKPKVPQVAVEFYERYKDDALDLGGWFSDFYSKEAIEDFPRLEELAEWLHDNDNETNRQREYALATLVTFGPDAVEVVEEPLGVLLADMPKGMANKYYFLFKNPFLERLHLDFADDKDNVAKYAHKVTEAEAKEKYPNFKRVSLEELENEK